MDDKTSFEGCFKSSKQIIIRHCAQRSTIHHVDKYTSFMVHQRLISSQEEELRFSWLWSRNAVWTMVQIRCYCRHWRGGNVDAGLPVTSIGSASLDNLSQNYFSGILWLTGILWSMWSGWIMNLELHHGCRLGCIELEMDVTEYLTYYNLRW